MTEQARPGRSRVYHALATSRRPLCLNGSVRVLPSHSPELLSLRPISERFRSLCDFLILSAYSTGQNREHDGPELVLWAKSRALLG